MAWLVKYAQDEGGCRPDMKNTYILPNRRRVAVFGEYLKIVESPLKKSRFYQLWTKLHPEIHLSTESSGFKQCETCFE